MKIDEVNKVEIKTLCSWSIKLYELLAENNEGTPAFAFVSRNSSGNVAIIESFGMDEGMKEKAINHIKNYTG